MINKSPVLLIVFNRPDQTREVLNQIRNYKPDKLYIYSDGPRVNNEIDKINCPKVKELTKTIDWECQYKFLFKEKNSGAGISVSSAIDWFFSEVDNGIILEDDCLPNLTFFDFCATLLLKYENYNNIMCISGTNILPNNESRTISFIKYPLMWGWASWKRAWEKFDFHLSDWPNIKKTNFLLDNGNWLFKKHWEFHFDHCYKGDKNIWDYQWFYTCWKYNGLTVIPNVNLISNIGFNELATHTLSNSNDKLSNLETKDFVFPIKYPIDYKLNSKLEKYISKYWFHITIYKYMRKKIKTFFLSKIKSY